MGTRRLQTNFFVCYWVEGEKLSPDRVNPLLRKFGKILKNFKIERQGYKAYVSVQGDTIIQEVDTRLLKVSSHCTFEILDSQPSNDVSKRALNHEESAGIHQGIKKLSLVDGTYSHKVTFTVKDTHQGSDVPMSRENSPWPTQRW